jgi:hypothetical protein
VIFSAIKNFSAFSAVNNNLFGFGNRETGDGASKRQNGPKAPF